MAIYTPPQVHDSIGLYRLSQQGIFSKAAPLYREGVSLRAIARELGIPKTTVRQTLINGGVALRPYSKRQVRHLSRPARMSIRTAPYGYCAIARRLNEQNIKPRKAAQWSQPTMGFIIQRELEAQLTKAKKNRN